MRDEKCIQNVGPNTWREGPVRSSRSRWEDNMRMDLREIGWKGVDWVHLAQERDQRLAPVNTIMNIWVPSKAGNFLTS
jgi:hypothetical protein